MRRSPVLRERLLAPIRDRCICHAEPPDAGLSARRCKRWQFAEAKPDRQCPANANAMAVDSAGGVWAVPAADSDTIVEKAARTGPAVFRSPARIIRLGLP